MACGARKAGCANRTEAERAAANERKWRAEEGGSDQWLRSGSGASRGPSRAGLPSAMPARKARATPQLPAVSRSCCRCLPLSRTVTERSGTRRSAVAAPRQGACADTQRTRRTRRSPACAGGACARTPPAPRRRSGALRERCACAPAARRGRRAGGACAVRARARPRREGRAGKRRREAAGCERKTGDFGKKEQIPPQKAAQTPSLPSRNALPPPAEAAPVSPRVFMRACGLPRPGPT